MVLSIFVSCLWNFLLTCCTRSHPGIFWHVERLLPIPLLYLSTDYCMRHNVLASFVFRFIYLFIFFVPSSHFVCTDCFDPPTVIWASVLARSLKGTCHIYQLISVCVLPVFCSQLHVIDIVILSTYSQSRAGMYRTGKNASQDWQSQWTGRNYKCSSCHALKTKSNDPVLKIPHLSSSSHMYW